MPFWVKSVSLCELHRWWPATKVPLVLYVSTVIRLSYFMWYFVSGWLAEHMLIVGITNPQGKKKDFAAAFPVWVIDNYESYGFTLTLFFCVFGSERLWQDEYGTFGPYKIQTTRFILCSFILCVFPTQAMMLPRLPGWKVECVGDDIAWMRIGKDGRLWAVRWCIVIYVVFEVSSVVPVFVFRVCFDSGKSRKWFLWCVCILAFIVYRLCVFLLKSLKVYMSILIRSCARHFHGVKS